MDVTLHCRLQKEPKDNQIVHFSFLAIGKTKPNKTEDWSFTVGGVGLELSAPSWQSVPPTPLHSGGPGTCEVKGCGEADVCGNGPGWTDAGNLVKKEAMAPGSWFDEEWEDSQENVEVSILLKWTHALLMGQDGEIRQERSILCQVGDTTTLESSCKVAGAVWVFKSTTSSSFPQQFRA